MTENPINDRECELVFPGCSWVLFTPGATTVPFSSRGFEHQRNNSETSDADIKGKQMLHADVKTGLHISSPDWDFRWCCDNYEISTFWCYLCHLGENSPQPTKRVPLLHQMSPPLSRTSDSKAMRTAKPLRTFLSPKGLVCVDPSIHIQSDIC